MLRRLQEARFGLGDLGCFFTFFCVLALYSSLEIEAPMAGAAVCLRPWLCLGHREALRLSVGNVYRSSSVDIALYFRVPALCFLNLLINYFGLLVLYGQEWKFLPHKYLKT